MRFASLRRGFNTLTELLDAPPDPRLVPPSAVACAAKLASSAALDGGMYAPSASKCPPVVTLVRCDSRAARAATRDALRTANDRVAAADRTATEGEATERTHADVVDE